MTKIQNFKKIKNKDTVKWGDLEQKWDELEHLKSIQNSILSNFGLVIPTCHMNSNSHHLTVITKMKRIFRKYSKTQNHLKLKIIKFYKITQIFHKKCNFLE